VKITNPFPLCQFEQQFKQNWNDSEYGNCPPEGGNDDEQKAEPIAPDLRVSDRRGSELPLQGWCGLRKGKPP
jgi:hypothetical protein